jgi:RNA polymerase sigma factor (sigma-70 family)
MFKSKVQHKTSTSTATDDWPGLVRACLASDRGAQRRLYDAFKGKLFGVCQRYASSRQEAEDLLQEGFVQVFRDLHQYRGEGSLEGWIRRVVVRVALQQLRQQKLQYVALDDRGIEQLAEQHDLPAFDEDMTRHLLRLLHEMPPGFRAVLNLYVFEGYTHREIGEALGISEGTSKSQYLRAKEYLRRLLEQSLRI